MWVGGVRHTLQVITTRGGDGALRCIGAAKTKRKLVQCQRELSGICAIAIDKSVEHMDRCLNLMVQKMS